MFVFLVLPILYPNNTPARFAKAAAMKTCPAAKRYMEAIKFKEKFDIYFFEFLAEYTYILDPSLHMRGAGVITHSLIPRPYPNKGLHVVYTLFLACPSFSPIINFSRKSVKKPAHA